MATVKTIQLTMGEGSTFVSSSELYYVTILRVERQGLVFKKTNINSPVPDFSFFYFLAGIMFFRNTGAPGGEKIKIMYKV